MRTQVQPGLSRGLERCGRYEHRGHAGLSQGWSIHSDADSSPTGIDEATNKEQGDDYQGNSGYPGMPSLPILWEGSIPVPAQGESNQ